MYPMIESPLSFSSYHPRSGENNFNNPANSGRFVTMVSEPTLRWPLPGCQLGADSQSMMEEMERGIARFNSELYKACREYILSRSKTRRSVIPEESSPALLQRQSSGLSDSKVSYVPKSEYVISLEEKQEVREMKPTEVFEAPIGHAIDPFVQGSGEMESAQEVFDVMSERDPQLVKGKMINESDNSDEAVFAAAKAVDAGMVEDDSNDNPLSLDKKIEPIHALDHSSICYEPFNKDLYEDGDFENLDSGYVAAAVGGFNLGDGEWEYNHKPYERDKGKLVDEGNCADTVEKLGVNSDEGDKVEELGDNNVEEGDVGRSGKTFSEMVFDIGWGKLNERAYDSFLCTLIKDREGMREVLKHFEAMTERDCCPSMKFFKFCIDECERKSDVKSAKVVWDAMIRKKICLPDTVMCRSLITLYCNAKDFDAAEKLLDGMVYYKAFPDSETYGLLYHFLIKHKRLREATPVFKEMVKNEFVPMQEDCSIAVKTYIASGDPHMGIKIWRCMVEHYTSDLDETANLLVIGLCDLNRVPEALKCAEDIIERGIKLNSSTLSKLKQSLSKLGKALAYEELLSKWKSQ